MMMLIQVLNCIGTLVMLVFAIRYVVHAALAEKPVEQPMPSQGPYRSSGGSPGNAAIDILLEDFNREAPKPEPEPVHLEPIKMKTPPEPQPSAETVIHLLSLEHRVDAITAEIQRHSDRLHALERRLEGERDVAFKKLGFSVVVALAVCLGGVVTHILFDFFGIMR